MNKKALATAALVGAAFTTGSTLSFADAVATTYLNVYNFQFSNAGVKLDVDITPDGSGTGDIQFVDGIPNNDGDTGVALNGATDSATGSAAAGVVLDIDSSCVGDCAYADNFVYIASPAEATSTYAVGDVLLTGSVVSIGGVDFGDADAQLLAEVSLDGAGNDVGSSLGNNVGVDAAFQFKAGYTGDLDMSFDADVYQRILLNDETGVVANSQVSFGISLFGSDGSVQSFTGLDILNFNLGITSPNNRVIDLTDSFSQTFTVAAGVQYDVSISGTVQANAETGPAVPAPATLALFALGLLGIGAAGRRRRV